VSDDRRLYSQATFSVKNQDILNDVSSHFKLERSVLRITSFEFANIISFSKIARLVLNVKCQLVVFTSVIVL